MRSNTNADWGSPDDVSDDAPRDLAPALFNTHKEVLERVDLAAEPVVLGHVGVEVDLRLWEADSILHVGCESRDFLLDSTDRVNERSDFYLDGGQVVREGRVAHQDYLYLLRRG